MRLAGALESLVVVRGGPLWAERLPVLVAEVVMCGVLRSCGGGVVRHPHLHLLQSVRGESLYFVLRLGILALRGVAAGDHWWQRPWRKLHVLSGLQIA